jgi:hypothetical protein
MRAMNRTSLTLLTIALAASAGAAEVPFGTQQVISTAADYAYSVFAADLDGDGDLDVLSASNNDHKVAWYENTDGAGTFGSQQIISTVAAGAPRSVAAADLDGDGDLDVLSALSNNDEIAWYENTDGAATFGSQQVISTLTDGAQSVAAADIDGDGDLDVLSASLNDDEIAWYENTDGAGTFGSQQVISTLADGARSVAAADIDGDGDLDVLSASLTDDEIAWYENTDGAGTFGSQQVISTQADAAQSVAAADIDGDGDLDVLSASAADNKIAWYENTDGAGTFGSLQTIWTQADGAQSVAAADIDGDGDLDVLSASGTDDEIAWYENTDGAGSFGTQQIISTAADGARSAFAADVDGDGDLDVLSASGNDDEIAWYENQTIHRSAVFPEQSVISTDANGSKSVFAADVDGDGDPDVLSASNFDSKVAWYENTDGAGSFGAQQVISTAASMAELVFAADIDGDGDLDALSASPGDYKIAWYQNTDGAGSFGAQQVISTATNGPRSVFAADVDGDGDLDVLSASHWDDEVAWYENVDGAGSFGAQQIISTNAAGGRSVLAADIDRDGDLDVVSASIDDAKIAWYENTDGAGSFGTQQVISTNAAGARFVFAADIDRDGDLDLTSASVYDDKIAWYENTDGTGNFGTQQVISTLTDSAYGVFAADLDGDGDRDVLSASWDDDKIAWYENTDGAGSFGSQQVVSTAGDAASSVVAADVDRDGDLDVLSTSFLDDKVTWYENRGGQFALATTDTAPAALLQGDTSDLLEIVMTHRGLAADGDEELDTLLLLFEETPGDPLTSPEANALIDTLAVYRDTGSGVFEAALDTLVASVGTLSLAAGNQKLTLPDGHAGAQVVHGTPGTFFAVVTLTSDAQAQLPNRFVVTHVTESGSTAEDRDNDILLTLEFAADFASRTVLAASPSSDADQDGLLDIYELGTGVYVSPTDTGTDPLDSDTDDDGASDGLEVTAGSDPTDPLSQPQGPFAGQSVISTEGDGAFSVFAADVDGDGDLDVLATSVLDNEIAWYENTDGAGSFGTQQIISTAVATTFPLIAVFAADVDGDGDLDALSASDGDDKIAWYENTDGAGGFGTQQIISTAADSPFSIFAADVDGDGNLDVLSASGIDHKIAWYENTDGAGSFGPQQVISTAAQTASSVFAADVDGDGDLDALSGSWFDDKIAWYENTDGAGSFGTQQIISTAADGTYSVFAADVDGDGDLDVLSASDSDDKIAWYENTDGAGSFGTQQIISTAADGASWVFAANVDGDGDLDVLSASRSDHTIAWYENTDGAGSFGTQQILSTAAEGAFSVFAADVDGDGDVDALSASMTDNKIAWYENQTIHRSALLPTQTTITTAADSAASVFAADVDGDGDLDVLSASSGDDKIAWYQNTDGAGSFGTQQIISTAADEAGSVFAADVDGDGDLDVLSASWNDDKIAWYQNTDGAGSFGSQQVISIAAYGARSVFAVDVDGDGDLDVLSASNLDDKIAWYQNTDGAGSFETQPVISTAANGALSVFSADVDGDGDLDVLSASYVDDTIAWYQNTDGAGSFGTQQIISTAADGARAVFAADVDGDGDLDALSASWDDDKIAWYENTDGAGSFGTQQLISSATDAAWSVFAADVDGDGDLDALSASWLDDKIAWYENTDGAGSFGTQQIISTAGDGAFSVFAADVDGDGDLDVLSASWNDDRIAWYENQGGQFALPTTSTAYLAMVDSQTRDVLEIEATHRGRAGDNDLELATLELRLTDGGGTPLSDAQADALFSQLAFYLDEGSGAFEAGSDTLVASASAPFTLSSGELTVAFADADPNVQVAQGTPRTYFAVATLQASASAASPNQFQLLHLTDPGSTAEDRSFDLPLSLEFQSDVATGVIQALGSAGDFDNDGVQNSTEVANGTDPGNPDTDGDGLEDGVETNTGTFVDANDTGSDPLDPDTDGDGLSDGSEVTTTWTDPTDADPDGDGICDGSGAVGGTCSAGPDNCPNDANGGQTNSDALPAGDLCQCGDLDEDGVVESDDLTIARQHLVGATIGVSYDLTRCNVIGPSGTGDCDVADIYVLERVVAGKPATVENSCAAYGP